MRSTSGRSSRSSLIAMNSRLRISAIRSFSNDSWAITWHQWQVEYPIERKMGLSWSRAAVKAGSPQDSQFTGLCACCLRYGLFSLISALVCMRLQSTGDPRQQWAAEEGLSVQRRRLDGAQLLEWG